MAPDELRQTTLHRLLWHGIALGSLCVLAVAAMLEPDPAGHGTHTQLGLPPCGFLIVTGAPCPGCGLTTAFAHAIRGDFGLAASANPLGLLHFAAVCASVPVALVALHRRWSIDAAIERFALGRWTLAIACSGGLLWVVRLAEAL